MRTELGTRFCRAIRRGAAAVRELHGDLVQASECRCLSGRAAVPRPGPMAWVLSVDGYRLTGSHLPDPGQPVS